jgi:hypothetical protein
MSKLVSLVGLLLLAGVAHAQGRASPEAMFEGADTNHDGLVSREELLAARAAQFSRLDRNDDGYLDDADVPKRLLARRPEGGGGGGLLRAQFDTDGDGRVSREEYAGGPTLMFDRADADKDGALNEQELAQAKAQAKAAVQSHRQR